MTVAALGYPMIIALFVAAAVGSGLAMAIKKYNFIPAIIAGICTVALVIYALYISLPTWELLSMLLILCVALVFALPKGGKT
ncbi:MAG: hypothetical protein J1F33_05415 [Clostridiales bacterium]|nr:hypothetical protein [Clostridiales bacterium]